MSRRLRRKGGDEENEVNLTPMLDVVFIMLIFFIVTASFTKESGVDVNRPDSSSNESTSKAASIVVRISAQNEVIIGNRRVDIRRVTANVQQRLAEDPRSSVVLSVHPESSNGTFVTVLDQARLAGGDRAGFNVAVVQPR
jgi:biopolymer transport protein ExbD